MERNREARRASIVGSNGFNRRRLRTTNSLRDSPDEDGGIELQESVRLRDRVKKDRDRERERERDLRERSSRSKRRRAERLMSNRDDIGGDETSEESVNDDEDDEDEENAAASGGRLLPPAVGSVSNHHQHGHISNNHHSSLSQQHNSNSVNHHLQHRKSFPPGSSSTSSSSSKIFRASPIWKPGDEIISVSVPRKARSASTKRSHDWISSSSNNNGAGGAAGGEQVLRQASSSPVRQGLASTSTPPPAAAAAAAAAPMSPSSSNPLFRKKLKPSGNNGGQKLKPPKASSKQSSSNPEELEIEIAEVLYGLSHQTQGPSSKKEDSREVNRSNSDTKSNSTSANNQILGSNSSFLQAVAPKRKRPRPVPENSNKSSPISAKQEMDQTPKSEILSPNLEKISGSTAENGFETEANPVDPVQPPPEPAAPEFKPNAEELRESQDLVAKEDKERESPAVRIEDSSMSIATAAVAATMIKANCEVETQREQKFEIDLMAPPPQVRSSPERETKIHLRDGAADQKPIVDAESKDGEDESWKDKEDEKENSEKELSANVAAEERKEKEESESKKEIENKGRSVGLQLDLEKPEINGNNEVNATGSKFQQQTQKQQQQEMPLKANKEEPLTEKSGQPKSSLPLPMPMVSWPGGLPPMGYMAPLQGVVSMDGTTVTPAPMQPLFSQPRSKRCATHCYIARNIHYLQQLMKMNPFWQAAAGSASLFGSKQCNLNIMPADLHSNMAARGLNNAPDKGQCLSSSPSNGGKDKGSQPVGTSDSAQRKQQLLIQQALPPVAPNNLLGPAFIFPLNQQAAVAAASARPSSIKSPPTTGGTASSTASGSVGAGTSPAAAMSFNYPGMPTNETQYLAILRNNGYPFPIPTVGAPPNYRGTAPQAMPLFNGSFYSSQMIHPSQLQHPQTQSAHPPQLQHAHQNASVSSGSASQKHLLTQSSNVNSGAGSANLQNFPSQKSQPSQQLQHASRPKHLESEPGSEDSAPTTDGRGSRASVNIYGQNFAMPIHPQNFALMTQSAALASAAAASGSSNQSEKKPQQPQQAVPPNSFAMSFGPTNGSNTGPGIDITAMAHNHAIFQSFPDATRQNIQMMAAAAQAAQKKNFRTSEDDKSGGGDSSFTDEERKNLVAKAPSGVGQSLTFARSDSANASVSSIQANSVVESSNRSQPLTANTAGVIHATNVNIHGLFQQQQQQQILQLKQKHQQQLAVNRSKAPATSNGIVFSDNLNSSSTMAAKFPNALAGFPQNLVQSNSSGPSQSPQWKSSTRAPTSQAPSALASSTATTLKNPPQQHSRAPTKMQTQISFGGNQNPSTTSQGQQPPSSNQVPSPPMMVGSPTTSSVSKGASGSPRTTSSASTNTKTGQSPSLPTQQQKNSSSIPSQKSQSILGNPHVASSSGSGAKPPMQQQSQLQQQQQQQLPKTMQHAQFFFSNPYSQAQSPHSISTSSSTSGPSGFYMQRRRPDQQQQQPAGLSTSSTGVLSLCPPVTLASTSTNDPTKAIAAVTSNAKGGGLPSQGIIHAAQFAAQSGGNLMPAGFSYVHPVTTAVQVKPAEQKQPAA